MTVAHTWLIGLLSPLFAAAALAMPHLGFRLRISAALLNAAPAFVLAITAPPSFLPDILWPGAQLGVTQHGRGWLGFTALVWAAAALYAIGADRLQQRTNGRFWLFWMTSCSGNFLLIISQDAISFYVGFSMMSLAAYGLVVHDGTPFSRRAGRLYLQLAVLGEMLLLTGIITQISHSGSTQFTAWFAADMNVWAIPLLIAGLGLKAGFWPLHVWLPLAHPAAPPAASAVLSGAMIKAGILGLWVFLPPGDQLAAWSPWMMLAGLASAFYGVAAGLARSDVKQALAYSSVSQVGYLLFVVALGWQFPDQRMLIGTALILYAAHHGFAKGALFLSADLLKTAQPRRIMLYLAALPALALAGLPATSGAAAKSALKNLLDSDDLEFWIVALQLGALATTLLLARILWLFRTHQQQAPQTRATILQQLACGFLCISALAAVWLWPAMRTHAVYGLQPGGLWDSIWPIAAGALVAVAAWYWRWRVPSAVADLPLPFEGWSLKFRRSLNKPLVTNPYSWSSQRTWRALRAVERRWNRLLQGPTVNRSAGLMIVFIVLAAALILL